MPQKRGTITNTTTRDILKFLFQAKVFAYRTNVLPIPMVRGGILLGFRPGSKSGVPDLTGIIPPKLFAPRRLVYGVPLYIEIKTGRDKLRPEQIGFIKNATDAGAIILVVKDFQDFKDQWKALGFRTK